MNKIIQSLSIAMIAVLMTLNVATAISAPDTNSLIPKDAYGVAEFQGSNLQGDLQLLFLKGVDKISEEIANSDISNFLKSHLLQEKVYVGVLNVSETGIQEPGIFILTPMSEEDFEEFKTLLGENLTQKDNIYGIVGQSETIFTFLDSHLLMTDSESVIAKFLEETPSLSDSMFLNEITPHFLENNFLNFWINFEKVFESLDLPEIEPVKYADILKMLSMSAKQTSEGFKFQNRILANESKIEALGINLDTTVKMPSLYQYMPNENPLLYFEASNMISDWDSLNLEGIEEEFEEDTGINFNEEILPILKNEFAFLLQNNGQIIPAGTLLIKVDPMEDLDDLAEETLDKFVNKIWEEITKEAPEGSMQNANKIHVDEEEVSVTIEKSHKSMFGAIMHVFKIQIAPKESKNPYAVKFPDGKFELQITAGVTNDHVLLISTNENIENDYGKNLLENTDFAENFEEKEVSMIEYLNFKNFGEYMLSSIEKFESANQAGALQEMTDAKEAISALKEALKDAYLEGEYTNSYLNTTFGIRIDLAKIKEFGMEMAQAMAKTSKGISRMQKGQVQFEDIETEWYSNDIYYLSTEGIINGYEDQTFKPGNEITRAEFTALLMRTLESKGYVSHANVFGNDPFTDVAPSDWYSPYINKAKNAKIANGYGDGSFHPNEPIARAEAVKMISNAILEIELEGEASEDEVSFSDVKETDWYFEAVHEARKYQIVDGNPNGSFAPLRPINRAESAKMIRKSLRIIKENEQVNPVIQSIFID
jgi:hypothetical protein